MYVCMYMCARARGDLQKKEKGKTGRRKEEVAPDEGAEGNSPQNDYLKVHGLHEPSEWRKGEEYRGGGGGERERESLEKKRETGESGGCDLEK
jgi:hypothetical protein